MHRVVIICDVEDATNWEKQFRTHADLFRRQTSTAMHYTVTDDNRVALYTEVSDLDRFTEVFKSPATAEAMSVDGVKRATVQAYVLDKDLPL